MVTASLTTSAALAGVSPARATPMASCAGDYFLYSSTADWQHVGYSVAKADYPTVSAGVTSAERRLQVC